MSARFRQHVSPQVEHVKVSLATSVVEITGGNEEKLTVTGVSPGVVRVVHIPSKADNPVNKTWICQRDRPDGLDGWPRFADGESSTCTITVLEDTSESCRVSFGDVEASFGKSGDFRVDWFLPSSTSSFCSDAVLDAYSYEQNGLATHRLARKDTEYYYGLGEVSGELNRAGRRFRLECKDSMGYDASRSDPLYKHFPFYITYDKQTKVAYGLFYDQFCSGYIDLGLEISAFRGKFRTYQADSGFVDYYLILGPSIPQVVSKLGQLIGRSAIPPKWALGYVASTMVYSDAPDAQERLEAFPRLCAEHSFASLCTGFYLSSGYTMDNDGNRNVFTWNHDRIPRPEAMLTAFRAEDICVVANVKPWLLTAHPEYKNMETGYFRTKTGQPLVSWFWKGGPGTFASGSYLDFTNEIVFVWWKDKVKELLGQGVGAIWNDNNEFEIEDSSAVCAYENRCIGETGRVLQTFKMAQASYMALREAFPDKRPLVVSRSGCLGISRYAAQTWSGDNTTCFQTMKYNIPMALGLSLCGWVSNGPDIGGFTGDHVTPELFLRWIQVGIYMPRFSIHSASWKGSGDEYNLDCTNEPWMFPEYTEVVRNLLSLRPVVQLLSLHLEASLFNSFPVIRPLVFHYADDLNERALEESFEFLLGDTLLVAPVLENESTVREVYFPGDNGTSVEEWCDLDSGVWYRGGTLETVEAPLVGRNFGCPVFLKSGSGLVLSNTSKEERVVILGCSEATQSCKVDWFEDPTKDGVGVINSGDDIVHIIVHAKYDGREVIHVESIKIIGASPPPFHTIIVKLPTEDKRRVEVSTESLPGNLRIVCI